MSSHKDPLNHGPRKSTTSAFSATFGDFYHSVVRMSWPKFLAAFVVIFLLINLLFGTFFWLQPDSIGGIKDEHFIEYFFFSVQTLATIGYGSLYPQTMYGHTLVTFEAMFGLLGLGMFAALAFTRLSLPRARVSFSDSVVVTTFDGAPTLMLRVAQARNNRIIDAEVNLSILLRQTTKEGANIRRLFYLNLQRNRIPLLSLTWLVMHTIDETSPLYGLSTEALEARDFGLIAMIKGIDETVSQTIHANHIYRATDIKWAHHFVDMHMKHATTGETMMDMSVISDTAPD